MIGLAALNFFLNIAIMTFMNMVKLFRTLKRKYLNYIKKRQNK